MYENKVDKKVERGFPCRILSSSLRDVTSNTNVTVSVSKKENAAVIKEITPHISNTTRDTSRKNADSV